MSSVSGGTCFGFCESLEENGRTYGSVRLCPHSGNRRLSRLALVQSIVQSVQSNLCDLLGMICSKLFEAVNFTKLSIQILG